MTASAPQRDGLGDVAAGRHAAVGDDVDVDAGLVEVAHPGARGVGDGRGLGHPDAEHPPRGGAAAGADADEDPRRARPHQVEGGLVAAAAADDDRDVEAAHERLQVERVARPS